MTVCAEAEASQRVQPLRQGNVAPCDANNKQSNASTEPWLAVW